MIRRIRLLSALATVAGLSLAAPSDDVFATTTIGTSLAGLPSGGFGCLGGCTFSFPTPEPMTPSAVLAPVDGVVVRWRVKVGILSSPAALRILRPGTSDTRTGAGTGPIENPPPMSTSTYDVRLPIQAGDGIGLNCCDVYPQAAYFFAAPSTAVYWQPALADGDPPTMGTGSGSEPLLNADIEADADRDGFGDESQDRCLGTGGPENGCPAPAPAAPAAAAPTPTGQRAAALTKCKEKAKKKHWTKKRVKKCKQKARLLPA